MYIQFICSFFYQSKYIKKWLNKSIHWFAAHTIALLHVFSCVLVKKQRYPSVCGYVCKYGSMCACMWNVECSLNICIYLYNCLWEFDFIVFFTLSICRNRCSATCRVNFLLYHCWPDVQFFGDLVAVTEYSIKKKRKSKPNGFEK